MSKGVGKPKIFKPSNSFNNNFNKGNKDMAKHPGFKAVEKTVQKEGYGKKAAGAIVAKASRKASKTAKKANPKLNKVKG